MRNCRYVLITPARNEERYIEQTIRSTITQTISPARWIIVSDGSTDHTENIVKEYLKYFDFIRLVSRKTGQNRDFSSKVHAFNAGYAQLQDVSYDFIGNLDADVSFSATYYESIINKFNQCNNLGIAGGVRYDKFKNTFIKCSISRNSVGGPIQLFRRECFEEIGGYKPIKIGGEDALVEITARMLGWRVESFPEIKLYHHRATGTADQGVTTAAFKLGVRDYCLGYHPVFELAKWLARLVRKPYGLTGFYSICGYFWASASGYEREVSENVLKFLRLEQIDRLRSALNATVKQPFGRLC